VLVLIAVVALCGTAFAQGEEDARSGRLSFSFNPREFFQVSPAESEPAGGADAGEDEAVTEEKPEEVIQDARAYVKLALYGLFRYEATEGSADTFKMPGAYIRGEGEWKNYKLSIMANAAVTDGLTWAYVDMAPWEKHSKKLQFRLGIFALPFGQQIRTFAYDLGSIDYSLIVDEVTRRVAIYDVGAMFHGHFKIADGGMNYAFGFVNGEYSKVTDTNDSKAFVGRLGIELSPEIEIGGSYYSGKSTDLIWMFDTQYERVGADIWLTSGNFNIRGEYIHSAEDVESHYSGTTPVWEPGPRCLTEGWWLDFGIFVWINHELSRNENSKKEDKDLLNWRRRRKGIEVYAHFQSLLRPPSADMKAATGHSTRHQYIYGIGVNCHLSKEVKLQVLWQHLDYGKYGLGLSGDRQKRDDRVVVQLSIAVF
jgi:hypothetical protein